MSFTLRSRLGAVAFGLLIAGCPTGDPDADPGTEDGGVEPGVDGGPGVDGQTPTDSAAPDSAPPPPACGRLTTVCADGAKCDGPPDCASKICRNDVCQAAAPADGTKNGDETDVDCGGSKAPACVPGKGCLVAADCTSSVCKMGLCAAPSPTDGVKNGDETGKDCGGAAAPKCAAGEGCLVAADCDKVKCDLVQKKCLPAAHNDGIKNLDETGIDCGGPTPTVARCAPGQGCAASTDCANVACNAGTLVCDPPSSTDGFKNGTETDVDCGGGAPTNAGACAAGLACLVNGDCTSAGCNHAKKCAQARSCVVQMGGTTCGKGEVGQAGIAHEDCCTSIPLPGNAAVRVDKYEITAGRMREFIRAVGNDVQTWVVNNRAHHHADRGQHGPVPADRPEDAGAPRLPVQRRRRRVLEPEHRVRRAPAPRQQRVHEGPPLSELRAGLLHRRGPRAATATRPTTGTTSHRRTSSARCIASRRRRSST